MKKVVGVLFLIFIMMATFSFAAYPADLEAAELQLIDATNLEDVEMTPIEPRNEENVEEALIEEDEIIYDDVYRMEEDVTINEIIDGNVYVMAKNIKIENTIIYGNVYVMAEKIEIVNSEIDGSIYAIGEEINFSGAAYDVYVCGAKINFDSDSYIWRSVRAAGETLNIDGNIGRNLYAGVSNLSIGDNAIIEGVLNYSSEKEGNISENAQISEVQFNKEEIKVEEENTIDVKDYIYQALTAVFKALIVVLIIVFGVHKFNNLKRTNNMAIDLLKNTAKGSLVLIFVPIISVLLMISLVGLGFGFIILALYAISLYIATSIMSVEIAHRILTNKDKDEIQKGKMIGMATLVALIIWAISFIPVIGGIIKFVLILMGLGIIYDMLFQRNKKEEVNEN